jgi:hypothetical protein
MTTPVPTPPAPPAPPAPQGQPPGLPPAGPGPAPDPPAPPAPPADPATSIARLENTLREERKAKKDLETRLATLESANQTEQEKAVKAARDEGKAEAVKEGAKRLAAAEFLWRAQGRVADPQAALELLDLSKFVKDDGEIDRDAIAKAVDHLAGSPPPPGRVPPGPRAPASNADGDFFRTMMGRQRT